MDAADSVNADRRPDLREDVLNRRFQIQTCKHCDESFRLDPQLNYLDVGRNQWISVQPYDQMREWVDLEVAAENVFEEAYGNRAPDAAKEIGSGITPRLTFGWAAMREKIVLNAAELDDVTVELMKIAMIRGLGDVPLNPGVECRLVGETEDGELVLSWIDAQTEATVEEMRVPRSLYDEIAGDDDWNALRSSLKTGPFVDLQKLYMGEGREPTD